MSVFKPFLTSDITVSPFPVNKSFTFQGIDGYGYVNYGTTAIYGGIFNSLNDAGIALYIGVNTSTLPSTPLQNTVGGKWNVLEIRAVGNEITVILNGIQTVKLNNSKFAAGPFALQYGPGVKGALGGPIKWRKVQVREVS